MPASRSRTEHWRDSLRRLFERGGALEITVERTSPDTPRPSSLEDIGTDLVWRVKMLAMTDQAIAVEPPAAFGASVDLQPGVSIIGAMTIGQNRWMFRTHTIGVKDNGSSQGQQIILAMPEHVERCTRRSFFRISTAELRLPRVQCWPLLNPASVAAAETANRLAIGELLDGRDGPLGSNANETDPDSFLLPEVGPMFSASLLNVSGGGLGLMIAPDDIQAATSRPHLWLRLDLRPDIPAPAALTARVAHTHVDSSHHMYAGLAFEFGHNAEHRRFVADLFAGYIESLQRRQRTVLRQSA